MMEKFLFFLEKLVALVTSQRTLVTIVGLIVLLGTAWAAIAPLFDMVAEMPDEEAINAKVAAILSGAAVVITALMSVVRVVGPLIVSIQERPPSLVREDYYR